jgi:hypothetical protein
MRRTTGSHTYGKLQSIFFWKNDVSPYPELMKKIADEGNQVLKSW